MELGYTDKPDAEAVNVKGCEPYQTLVQEKLDCEKREVAYQKKKEKFDAKTWLDREADQARKAAQEKELAETKAQIASDKERIFKSLSIVLRNWPVIEGQVLDAIEFTFNDVTDVAARIDGPSTEYLNRYPNQREIWRRNGGPEDAFDNLSKMAATLAASITSLGGMGEKIDACEDDPAPIIAEAEGLSSQLQRDLDSFLQIGTEEYYTREELQELSDIKNTTLQSYHSANRSYLVAVKNYLQKLTESGEYDNFDYGEYYWNKEIEQFSGRSREMLENLRDAKIPLDLARESCGEVLKNFHAACDSVPFEVRPKAYQFPDGPYAGYTIQRSVQVFSDGTEQDC